MPRKTEKPEQKAGTAKKIPKTTVKDAVEAANIEVKAAKTTKVVKKIPSSENGPPVTCTTRSGQVYIITQNKEKMRFTLWQKTKDGYKQLSTAKSPLILEDKVPWDK